MASVEGFRIKSHELLLELDAATMGMMTVFSSKCVSGPDWDFARGERPLLGHSGQTPARGEDTGFGTLQLGYRQQTACV